MVTQCPHLRSVKKDFTCGASVTNMTPSIFEIDIYCTSEEHDRCPILLAMELRDGNKEYR